MVRYGAACSLYNLLVVIGADLLHMEPNLTSQIISGCMDSNCTIMAVHLESLMHMAKLLKSEKS